MAKKIDWDNKKINTIEKFKEYLFDTVDESRFMLFDNQDPSFASYPDEQISFHGTDEDEVFTFLIVKVEV